MTCPKCSGMKFSREWAMPSADTFTIEPIEKFVYRHSKGVSVDPFARNHHATYSNDLNPSTSAAYHMDALEFLRMLVERGVKADTLIFDPPYSPRQITEYYATAGLKAGMKDTQSAVLMKQVRGYFRQLAAPDATCLSFGWNTVGMGKGWGIAEIMLVCHGGAHNDTICMAERKIQGTLL